MRDLLFQRDPLQPVDESAISDDANEAAIEEESDEEQTQTHTQPLPLRRAITAGSTKSKRSAKGVEIIVEREIGQFIGAIDQGTTSSRFIIFDDTGMPVAKHQVELSRIHEKPGYHEQDPEEIYTSVLKCMNQAMKSFASKGYKASDILTVGMTSQRETTLVWDYESGKLLHNSIAWPDTRHSAIVREFKEKEGARWVEETCGLPLSTYPSALKLVWLIRNVKSVRDAYDAGRLAFGTVDTWLMWRLNGGVQKRVFVTDVTNASRTMFMNLSTLKYDDDLLKFFEIDKSKIRLPEIKPSSHPTAFGVMVEGPLIGKSITSCLGDQSAALVGHCAFEPGSAKNTYGTGCFLLYNVGSKPVLSKHGLLATVGYQLGEDQPPVYALEGSIAVAGSGVSFLMNNFGFFADPRKVGEEAASVPDNGGCYFVTAFSGLFAPYWIDDAKGTMFGITAHTQRGHVARATLEAVCYQTRAILEAMELDSGKKLSNLAVDGGLSNSDLCMQTQADVIRIPVHRPSMHEITALGACIAAGFAIKLWTTIDDVRKLNASKRQVFTHKITTAQSERMYQKWTKAVEMCRGWVDADELQQPEDEAEDASSGDDRHSSDANTSARGSQAFQQSANDVAAMRRTATSARPGA
ncbi:Glycerol kinase [Ascosphaera acerosa]|nr:Glycerol kinase [Ascosphaera acerosa]